MNITHNKFNRNQFLRLVRKLRAEGNVTISRKNLGGCQCIFARLDGTQDHVALYQGVTGHVTLGCGFTR